MFDHVEEPTWDLSAFHDQLETFALDHFIFDVTFDQQKCSLTFNTLGGSQQFKDTYEAGQEMMEKLVEGRTSAAITETSGIGWSRLRIEAKQDARLPTLNEEKGWSDWQCIWVAVGEFDKSRTGGRFNIGMTDKSAKEVQRVTRSLLEGRPWLARCSGRGGKRTVSRGCNH
jgi:hypothetical protein